MLKLSKDELMFLRWLRTNGGKASLPRSPALYDLVQRILAGGLVTEEPVVRSETTHLTLTAQGYEALGLHGHG
jgi:hypothetical protein